MRLIVSCMGWVVGFVIMLLLHDPHPAGPPFLFAGGVYGGFGIGYAYRRDEGHP